MRYHRTFSALALAAVVAISLLAGSADCFAQFDRRRSRDFRYGGGMSPPSSAKPADDKEKKDENKDEKADEKKPDDKKPEEKKDEGPPAVQRPLAPERPADPRELSVEPDDDGKIRFSFKGQPWPSVLEWLADVSDMSLEWEEAPAGYLDLTTRGKYTVDEVRDLVNSVLLNKGFTVLRNGEVLIVVNLKKLDSSLVPRVTPAELEQRGNYELVRAFFDLDWLVAESAAEEIKPLLSPFGKATPLKATNRLDVLDTAGNLRRIRELLSEEQSSAGQQRLVREFKLRYTRADEVLDTLNTLLGIETKQSAATIDPRQLMQAMMMAREGGQQGMAMGKKENTVFLAVNVRENSILANAPPDKMGVIEQAVLAVDVPSRGKGFLADAQRVKVYRLSGLQPETLVKVLKELGSLDPTTRLEADPKKNAVIAYAPLADHLLITDLVERLDGASRKFEVIQLRTLSAEYVAGSIITLMNGPEKQSESSRSRYRYDYFDSGSQPQDTTDKFWVEADVERNRLLLRANEVELAEVRALLVKLGEIPADQRAGNTTRVVPAMPSPEMKEGLKRVEEMWRSISPSPLEVDIDPRLMESLKHRSKSLEEPASGRRKAPDAAPPAQPRGNQSRGNRSAAKPSPVSRFRFAQDRVEIVEEAQAESPAEPENSEVATADSKEETKTPAADDSAAIDADAMDADESQTPAEAEGEEKPAETPPKGADADDAASETGEERPAEAAEGAMRGDDKPENESSEKEDSEKEDNRPLNRRDAAAAGEPAPSKNGADLPRRAHAPVKITLGPQGLVISSSDTDALDRLEELLNNVMPPRTNYEMFTLRHTYAKDMVTLLKDIFKSDLSKDSNGRSEVFDMFWNGRGSSSNQPTRATLSKRRPLNFVADPVTNTVLVQGADAGQLAEIEELIERYDRAEPPNSESVRRTTRIALRYAKAKEVADVVKDVYRDLLSPNDKALVANQPPQQQQQQRSSNDNFYSAMFSYLTDDPTKSEIVPRFKGMLSVGIDERANGVVISAPQIILTEVLKMVDDLDRSAKPSRPVVRVLRVRTPGTAAQVEQALNTKKAAAPMASTPAAESTIGGNGKTEAVPGGARMRVSR